MSKRTRVSNKIDAQRLGALVSRPGIDPRMWISLCVVDSVTVEAATGPEGSGGVFADVHIMTTATLDDQGVVVAQKETVRVAPAYAGNGFGLFFPPAEGDEVLVAWADGDPDHGGILIARTWSASDPPPQLAVNNPNDALLMIAKDANLRIVAQGKGNVVVQIDKGKVLLGNEKNTIPVARKGDHSDAGTLTIGAVGTTAVTVTYVDPDGNTQGPTNVTGLPTAFPLKAKLTEGSPSTETT